MRPARFVPASSPLRARQVLSGGVIAAFGGPQAAIHTRGLYGPKYSGAAFSRRSLRVSSSSSPTKLSNPARVSPPPRAKGTFACVVVVALLNTAFNSAIRFPPKPVEDASDADAGDALALAPPPPRALGAIFCRRRVLVAVSVATIAHTAMTMLMSPLTLAMEGYGFSFGATQVMLRACSARIPRASLCPRRLG